MAAVWHLQTQLYQTQAITRSVLRGCRGQGLPLSGIRVRYPDCGAASRSSSTLCLNHKRSLSGQAGACWYSSLNGGEKCCCCWDIKQLVYNFVAAAAAAFVAAPVPEPVRGFSAPKVSADALHTVPDTALA